jgi:hypothetical protein
VKQCHKNGRHPVHFVRCGLRFFEIFQFHIQVTVPVSGVNFAYC